MPRSEELLDHSTEDLYENAPCGYLSLRPDGTVGKVNATFLAWTGYAKDDLVGRRRFVDLLTGGGRIYHETHLAPLLRMQGAVRSIALDLRRADASTLPVLVDARSHGDSSGRPVVTLLTVFDASDRQAYEHELLLARRNAEQYAERLRVLEKVVADLAGVADVEGVVAVVAEAGVSAFGARRSMMWLADSDGGGLACRAVRTAHGPVPLEPDSSLTPPVATLPAEVVRLAPAGEDGSSVLLVPLAMAGRLLGVLELEGAPGSRADPADLAALLTLGQQAAQAVARAQLYEEQRSVATTLQRSMLPSSLPRDPRVVLAPTYRPAESTLEVGGDWYDAFPVGADHLALVVGDVVGRGLPAAAVMGQLRSAVRALSVVGSGPAELLERLDSFAASVPAAEIATVAYVLVDLRDGTARYACAGHPPPAMVTSEGQVTLLWEGRSSPLGTHFGSRPRPEGSLVLGAGARLVLYTDGLIERRDRGLDQGLDALAGELARLHGVAPEQLSVQLTDAMLHGVGARDDVCVLVLAHAGEEVFRHVLPADRSRVADLRSDLGRWLARRGVEGPTREAAVLACSEAVANAIEHGYRDDRDETVEVVGAVTEDEIALRVRDTGCWRTPGPPGHRGRGLRMIRELMDVVEITQSTGTVVAMRLGLTGHDR